MSGSKEEMTVSITSDEIHNKNCFNYLRNVKLPDSIITLGLLPPDIATAILSLRNNIKEDYDPNFPYADLYTKFFDYLEDNIKDIYDDPRERLNVDRARIKIYQEHTPSQEPFPSPDFQKSFIMGLGVLPSIKETRALDSKVERLDEEINALDEFISSLYANDNYILEDTFESIKDITLEHNPSSPSIKKSISHHIRDKKERINLESNSPSDEEKIIRKAKLVFADDYKPQHGTSLSTVRHHRWNTDGPIEYRFGTQGQRHHGEARVSPLFERFLKIEAEKEEIRIEQAKRERAERLNAKREQIEKERSGKEQAGIVRAITEIEEDDADIDEDKITHVYFNLLGRDRTDLEGSKEKALTDQLEALELHTNQDGTVEGHKNIAVITLPGDKGLMAKDEYTNTEPKHEIQTVKNEFFLIASENPDAKTDPRDFHISERIRRKIFCDDKGRYSPETEAKILNQLLDESFNALGYSGKEKLSDAERQAVWFHFIKFELTNHIIQSLKPKSINFTCKDAIDRGGVASAYYNLVKSFERLSEEEKQAGKEEFPMSREEFEQALHAAPAMVKGRGMNHHINLIWNAVDAYVNKNYADLKNDEQRAWLIEWRDFNCPHERVEGLLKRRIHECKDKLASHIQQKEQQQQEQTEDHTLKLLKQGLDILNKIEKQTTLGVSGKRLLLETALRTTSMAIDPLNQIEKNKKRYEELYTQLSIDCPEFNVLGGLMLTFFGTVIDAVLWAVSAASAGKIDAQSNISAIPKLIEKPMPFLIKLL